MSAWRVFSYALIMLMVLGACVRNQPQVVVITATAQTAQEVPLATSAVITPELPSVYVFPTLDPTRPVNDTPTELEYVVKAGDTLYGIASQNNVSLETLLKVNNISDPNLLTVGQVIVLPAPPSEVSEAFKIIPDSRLVRGPGSRQFDVVEFVNQQPGYIRIATDIVDDKILSATEVVERISVEFSVDARLLLILLEYQSAWLTTLELSDDAKIYPIQGRISEDGVDRSGLYKQLAWAANQLNRGYYDWKYNGTTTLELKDGTRLRYADGLNAGTVSIQYFLSLQYDYVPWSQAINREGFYRIYTTYFGDPFINAVDLLVPTNIQQPELTLPFSQGQTWLFTGGPHGGWGSGSAWAAVDFAPPDDRPDGSPLCYTSDFWTTAVANGVVTHSKDGMVILDLDNDGDETTGWVILYLHMANDMRVQAGAYVNVGDVIGRPSCEGGFSTATHMHIARRYNGDWIPVNCEACITSYTIPAFVMSGWTLFGLANQEYQGYMQKNGEERSAEQGRLTTINQVSW